jgi:hypothetical protein
MLSEADAALALRATVALVVLHALVREGTLGEAIDRAFAAADLFMERLAAQEASE